MERQAVAKAQKVPTSNNHPQRQSAPSTHAGHALLGLQRAFGNQAIRRLTTSPFIQAKLQISTPEDPSEQEADRVANSVMRMTVPSAQPREEEKEETIATKPVVPLAVREDDEEKKITPFIQRRCTQCEEEKLPDQEQAGGMVHRKSAPKQLPDNEEVEEQHVQSSAAQTATPNVTTSVAANIHAMNGGGHPLPATTRAFFEPRFGADLSEVRVHTDSRAAATASSINARAFTVGHNIAFGSGRYVPHSYEGRQLIAHELTHVMQQSANRDAVHRQPDNVIFRRTTAQERQEQKRDAWLKELGNYPPDAHQEWKGLTNMEKMAVVIQMTKRYGYDFAKDFLSYTKRPIKSSTQHFGPGFPEHTPDWFRTRGYRLWQRGSFNEFWVHPSGSLIMQILDQKKSPPTAEDHRSLDPPVEDCSGVADATLSILRDTTATETSVKEDLEGTKGRLEKMDKTTDDYCQQYDEYIQSLQAMKARVDTTVDDIDTMRQQLVEQKCSVSNIDSLLQDLTDLQIWAEIESSPMNTQFLQCLRIRGPKESTEEE